jgi:hypothetical protein
MTTLSRPRARSCPRLRNFSGRLYSQRSAVASSRQHREEKSVEFTQRIGAGNHARIIYGYGSQGGTEKLVVMDPNGGKPQTFEWTEFDRCGWIVWCKKEAAGGEKKTNESK